jgi:hypothetical protein
MYRGTLWMFRCGRTSPTSGSSPSWLQCRPIAAPPAGILPPARPAAASAWPRGCACRSPRRRHTVPLRHHKHPKANGKQLRRRHLDRWWPTDHGVALSNPGRGAHSSLPLPRHASPRTVADEHASRTRTGMSVWKPAARRRARRVGGAGRGNGSVERSDPRSVRPLRQRTRRRCWIGGRCPGGDRVAW